MKVAENHRVTGEPIDNNDTVGPCKDVPPQFWTGPDAYAPFKGIVPTGIDHLLDQRWGSGAQWSHPSFDHVRLYAFDLWRDCLRGWNVPFSAYMHANAQLVCAASANIFVSNADP